LAKWGTLKSAKEKVSLLGVLSSVDLGDVIYSGRFAEIIEAATAPKANKSVREAGFGLLAKQVLRSCRSASFGRSPGGEVDPPERSGCFPTLVAPDSSDPVITGLVRAATQGSRRTQIEALAALLVAGYAEEAERSMLGGSRDDAGRNAVLAALLEQKDVAGSYGLAAMLGRMLRKDQASNGPVILGHLDRMMEKVPPGERWQTYAAVKAGGRLDRLCVLASSLNESDSPAALRWVHELGHMTPQDRQRLAVASDMEDRLARLARIDHRRALLVDGQYGVIAIVEVIEAEKQGESGAAGEKAAGESSTEVKCRWGAPRHVTVVLPPLRIESIEQGDAYQVLWGKQVIGKGSTQAPNQPIHPPEAYCVRLVRPDEGLLGAGGWGWAGGGSADQKGSPAKEPERAAGPLVLPAEHPPPASERGTMTLDVGEYLEAALGDSADDAPGATGAQLKVPARYEIRLQYASFGSFYGSGNQISLASQKMRAGRRYLFNIAMILERMD
jgi:hypothetical protein